MLIIEQLIRNNVGPKKLPWGTPYSKVRVYLKCEKKYVSIKCIFLLIAVFKLRAEAANKLYI